MKLTKLEREEYRDLKVDFVLKGGKFVRGRCAGREVTAAVTLEGKFFHVAIAVQGLRDAAVKKRGNYEALCKLYNNCYIPVPKQGVFQYGTITQELLWTAFQIPVLH